MNEPLKKITIHPEWKELCEGLEPLEGYALLNSILNLVLFGVDVASKDGYRDIYDRYERLVWKIIRNDIIADIRDQ